MRITQGDKTFAHSVRYRDGLLRAWMRRTKQGNSYRPEDVPAYIDRPTNEQRGVAELIEFCARPLPYGKTYAAYLTRDATANPPWRITTWMGNTLATVTTIKRAYSERGSFWARGVDGRLYHGRHNGSGMWCTMRLAKDQS
jgi:hypothetical protein